MKNGISLCDLGTTFETFVCITNCYKRFFSYFRILRGSIVSVHSNTAHSCTWLSGSITKILFIFKLEIHFLNFAQKDDFILKILESEFAAICNRNVLERC